MLDLKECAKLCDEALTEAYGDYCTACSFEGPDERKWRQLAIESMWRLLESGLIFSLDVGRVKVDGTFRPIRLEDLVNPDVDYYTDAFNWGSMTFNPTPAGVALVEEFHLVDCEETPPGFEKRLWDIFTQHGVGPDVPCPYQLPLDWKPKEREQGEGMKL